MAHSGVIPKLQFSIFRFQIHNAKVSGVYDVIELPCWKASLQIPPKNRLRILPKILMIIVIIALYVRRIQMTSCHMPRVLFLSSFTECARSVKIRTDTTLVQDCVLKATVQVYTACMVVLLMLTCMSFEFQHSSSRVDCTSWCKIREPNAEVPLGH